MNASHCNLCNNTDFTLIGELDRHGDSLSTVACQKCGLVQHEIVPSEEELQQFYSTDYRKAYNGERTPGVRRIMRAWNNGERICHQISDHLSPNGRVLEVGAGIGCTVKVFEKAGFEAEGIDPGDEFLKFSREKLNADVRTCSLFDLPEEASYDTVLLVHVIEHLRSPKTALQTISKLLKRGGMFYVECPNLQAPFARRAKLFHTAHIYNFVPSTLKMLAESCGFELVEQFGDPQNTNLQMLFKNTQEPCLEIDEANHDRTVRELTKSDFGPYFCRTRYCRDRITKLASYANEHRNAQRFVEELVQACSKSTDSSQPARRAA